MVEVFFEKKENLMNPVVQRKPMERVNGSRMMGHGGVTNRGCKQLKCGMKPGVTGMKVGQLTGPENKGSGQRSGPGLVKKPL